MQIQVNGHSILILAHGFVDVNDVADWLQMLVQQQLLSIAEINIGADRAQWLVNYAGQMLIVFFEELTEDLWFESLQREEEASLQSLSRELKAIV